MRAPILALAAALLAFAPRAEAAPRKEPESPPSLQPLPTLQPLPPVNHLPGWQEPPLTLTEPALPPPRDVHETGESPHYYRLPPNLVGAAFRLGLGMHYRLPLNGDTGKVAFAFEVLTGVSVRFYRGSKAGALIEGGYSYIGFGEHLAQMGLGFLVRDLGPPGFDDKPRHGAIAVGLLPRFVVGTAKGELTYGERSGLLLVFWGFGLELGHQLTLTNGHPTHELHLTFATAGFDIGGST